MIRIEIKPDPVPSWCQLHPSAYSEAVKEHVGAVPGVTWIRDAKASNGSGYYRAPADTIELLKAVICGARLAMITDTREAEAAEPRSLVAPLDLSPWPELYAYQVEGVQRIADALSTSGAHILADDMGLGKTAQALVAAQALNHCHVTVICPASVRTQWRRAAVRWAPGVARADVFGFEEFALACGRVGKPRKLTKDEAAEAKALEACGVIITPPTYAAVALGTLVIVDELHYLMTAKTARTKAVRLALGSCEPRPAVIGLTGTPVTARVRDLHSQLEVLFPARFGDWFRFTRRYCGGRWEEIPHTDKTVWITDGASNLPELQSRLASVMTRRMKAEVADQLPALTRIIEPVELPLRIRRALARAFTATQSEKAAARSVPGGAAVSGALAATESHKVLRAVELAQEAIASGRRPMIFTGRKATAVTLGLALNVAHVTGDTPPDQREAILRGASCGVATMLSVGTGGDYMSGYDVAIFVGLDYVPANLLQAEARLHRIGQVNPVTAYYLIGVGTIDEMIQSVVVERLANFEALQLGSSMGEALRGGSDDELLDQILSGLGL